MSWSSVAMDYVGSWIVWIMVGAILLVLVVAALWVRRTRRFSIPIEEQIDLGMGKIGLKRTFKGAFKNSKLKAGWFARKKVFFGLFDVGTDRELLMNDGRIVQCGSTIDFHDIEGERGLLVQRKADDPRIVVPITSVLLSKDSKKRMDEIAPADFTDAASKAFEEAAAESRTGLSAGAIAAMSIGAAVILFIAIVLVIQYATHEVQASRDFAKTGIEDCRAVAKEVCKGVISTEQNTIPASSGAV